MNIIFTDKILQVGGGEGKRAQIGTKSKQVIINLIIFSIIITVKYLELTNHHYPSLKLTIKCKAETANSFSQRRMSLT